MNKKMMLAILAILVVASFVMMRRTNRFELNTETSTSDGDRLVVQSIVDQKYYGEPQSTENLKWRFVVVVNPQPLMQEFGNGWRELPFGDECGIGITKSDTTKTGSGLGSIRIRGIVGQRTLYEFTKDPYNDQLGTPCPSGTLFFAKQESGR